MSRNQRDIVWHIAAMNGLILLAGLLIGGLSLTISAVETRGVEHASLFGLGALAALSGYVWAWMSLLSMLTQWVIDAR